VRDDRVDELGIGREKMIPDNVGIGGRRESLPTSMGVV